MDERLLTDQDVEAIAKAIREEHPCHFEPGEVRVIHNFAQSIEGENWAKWQSVLAFGGTLIQARKAGIIALVGTLVAGILAVIWSGIQAVLKK